MTFDNLCTAARSKYNNMDASGEYTRVDPKDAKILALTTRLESLKKSTAPNSAHATTGGGGGTTTKGGGDKITDNNPTGKMSGNVATWRTINVGPTSMAPDGTTVHWCPHHVHPHGLFNGTYGWYEPKEHDAWKVGLLARRGGKKTSANLTNATPAAAQQESL